MKKINNILGVCILLSAGLIGLGVSPLASAAITYDISQAPASIQNLNLPYNSQVNFRIDMIIPNDVGPSNLEPVSITMPSGITFSDYIKQTPAFDDQHITMLNNVISLYHKSHPITNNFQALFEVQQWQPNSGTAKDVINCMVPFTGINDSVPSSMVLHITSATTCSLTMN